MIALLIIYLTSVPVNERILKAVNIWWGYEVIEVGGLVFMDPSVGLCTMRWAGLRLLHIRAEISTNSILWHRHLIHPAAYQFIHVTLRKRYTCIRSATLCFHICNCYHTERRNAIAHNNHKTVLHTRLRHACIMPVAETAESTQATYFTLIRWPAV